MYYVNSASLVLLCALIVDMVAQSQLLPATIDLDKTSNALKLAQQFFRDDNSRYSIVPKLPNRSARTTARHCHSVIRRISKAIIASAEIRLQHAHSRTLSSYLGVPLESSSDAQSAASLTPADASREDLCQAFLNLLPDSQQDLTQDWSSSAMMQMADWSDSASFPNIQDSGGVIHQQQQTWPGLTDDAASMSSWSMRDLLVANCLPS